MSFSQKSAWVMLGSFFIALIYIVHSLYTGAQYSHINRSIGFQEMALLAFILPIVIVAVIGHVVLALIARNQIDTSLDEREIRVVTKARKWSIYFLIALIVFSLQAYLMRFNVLSFLLGEGLTNGDGLFMMIAFSLLLWKISEYALQLILFKRGEF